MATAPRYKVPYIVSRYLGYTVHLDELQDMPDNELALIQTEAHTIFEDCGRSIETTPEGNQRASGTVFKMHRTAATFLYAIQEEKVRRQRKESINALIEQLNSVTTERDALKSQLAEVLLK